jgi:hypothetical protein
LLIIWKALTEYLYNNLSSGKSIYVKKFGAFTFDINTELPRIANKSIGANGGDLHDQRQERKHVHNVRYVFVFV